MKKYNFVIGIDPGTITGFATWSCIEKKLITVESYPIHKALIEVYQWDKLYPILFRVEDARLRKWFGESGKEQLQGAGSIKRDCSIWEDFLKDIGVDYEMVKPAAKMTKVKPDYFKQLTGWQSRTSKHSRDAAMLCFKYQ